MQYLILFYAYLKKKKPGKCVWDLREAEYLLEYLVTKAYYRNIYVWGGGGSSVRIATDYELGVPESNPGRDKIFHPSRPALGSTQPSVQWVPCLSRV